MNAPKLNESLANMVVIDGLPVAPAAKMTKLKSVVQKVLKGFEVQELELVTGEDGAGLGFAFVEFKDPEEAGRAVEKLDGYKLDKKHTFSAILMEDFDRYVNTPEEWEAPKEEEYNSKQDHLQDWLLDEECRDQYAVTHSSVTRICWNRRINAVVEQERPRWTEKIVAWSPQGSYLATFHPQGIALWGTSEWARLARFSHASVSVIDFSPCERYLVTWGRENQNLVNFWDIASGKRLRQFDSPINRESWPWFKWSHDGNYFAKLGENSLIVYETPSMTKLNKKNIVVPGIQAFAWSPSDSIVAYWTPERNSMPARIVLMSLPDQKIVATKNIFQVKECRLTWQEHGDYLAVEVVRHTKSKKKTFSDFEIFHLRKKMVPCDKFEIRDREIHGLQWEPNGSMLSVTCSMPNNKEAAIIVFFDVATSQGVVQAGQFDKPCNVVRWSPAGRFCVFGSGANVSGELFFADSKEMTIMNSGEHSMASQIQWDPTGRYVITSVNQSTDAGYYVWSFQGALLQRHNVDRFNMLLWRPRPKSLIDDDDLKQIQKDFKKYQGKFEADDKRLQSKASEEMIDRRRQLANEWSDFIAQKRSQGESLRERLAALRPDLDLTPLEEVSLEKFVSETEEVVEEESSA